MSTRRSDLANAMFVGILDVWTGVMKKPKQEEWKQFMTIKKSDKKQEDYLTVGNLKPAHEKVEGAPVEYGKITETDLVVSVDSSLETPVTVYDIKADTSQKVSLKEFLKTIGGQS